MLDSAVREAGIALRYVERLLEVRELQYVGLALNITQIFGACCEKEVFELKNFSVEDIRKLVGR